MFASPAYADWEKVGDDAVGNTLDLYQQRLIFLLYSGTYKQKALPSYHPLNVLTNRFCQSCFYETPAAGDWIMRPELSKAHLGEADRDLDYEKEMQLQPHIVYLALSSHLKVGVTRKKQLPTRWIDQGADQAMSLLEVPNRYLAGVGEVALKDHFSDKTNWRKMLQNENEPIAWEAARNKAIDHLPKELKPYIVHQEQSITQLQTRAAHRMSKDGRGEGHIFLRKHSKNTNSNTTF